MSIDSTVKFTPAPTCTISSAPFLARSFASLLIVHHVLPCSFLVEFCTQQIQINNHKMQTACIPANVAAKLRGASKDVKCVKYVFQHTSIAVVLQTSVGSECVAMVDGGDWSTQCDSENIWRVEYSTEEEGKALVESIHNQVIDLLGDQNYQLQIDSQHMFLPVRKGLKATTIHSQTPLHSKALNRFFSASPHHEHLEISNLRTGGVYRNPKVFRVDSLRIGGSSAQVMASLENFKGCHAQFSVMENNPTFDVMNFLSSWRSGKSHQKLESLTIHVNWNVKKVKGGLSLQQLACERNWPRFERDEIDFTTNSYVVRASDRRVASVLVEKKRFWFGAWDMTEDEFLKKFDGQ